jgi:adhesin transport system outer membrane protein
MIIFNPHSKANPLHHELIKMKKILLPTLMSLMPLMSLLSLLPSSSYAQVQSLSATAQQALNTHPEVLARWHAYAAAKNEREVASGGLKPRVDLTAGVGRERLTESGQQQSFGRNSAALTLTQLLYDGQAKRNEVQRFQFLSSVRLYEIYDTAENVALETSRAFFDVLRYRKLLTLAEDNYVQHKLVFEQLQVKVNAGVARRVDLEQANGRLALAETNLITETSNLHDVSARFQRVTGAFPAKEMEIGVTLERDLPPNITSALRAAIGRHPALRAAIENVRSADAAAKIQQGAYHPRLDFRLRGERDHNLDGNAIGTRRDNAAELVLSWNLFNGGSDQSRVRQYADLLNQARDERDKACIDVRQNLTIAYNDARKLHEQLAHLDQHQISVDKARQAYRKQFEVGQRTLLDVLDTENELLQARRAFINAEYDLQIAWARAHAGYGDLVAALNAKLSFNGEAPPDLRRENIGDAVATCGPETAPLYLIDKTALDMRARDLMNQSGGKP